MTVDSFKYVSPLIARYYRLSSASPEGPLPWIPLQKPLDQARFALVTSGGLYHKGHEPPFDMEREQAEPTWGDPTSRTLPSAVDQVEVGVSHHHINPAGVLADVNVLLPVGRFRELVEDGTIGALAPHAYSFMGYQGFPADLTGWREDYGPQVAEKMLAEGADCILLTTA